MLLKNLYLFLLMYVLSLTSFAQESKLIKGVVVNDSIDVGGIIIINKNLGKSTKTNNLGLFELPADIGNTIVITAVHIKRKSLVVTKEIIDKSEVEISVVTQVNEMKEIVLNEVLSPTALDFSAALKPSKQGNIDAMRRTEITSMANTDPTQVFGIGGGGVGTGAFNILEPVTILFKKLVKKLKRKSLSKSEKLENKKRFKDNFTKEYGVAFFTTELKISELQIDDFITYCDKKQSLYDMYSKNQKLDLIDFLIKQSKLFRKEMHTGN